MAEALLSKEKYFRKLPLGNPVFLIEEWFENVLLMVYWRTITGLGGFTPVDGSFRQCVRWCGEIFPTKSGWCTLSITVLLAASLMKTKSIVSAPENKSCPPEVHQHPEVDLANVGSRKLKLVVFSPPWSLSRVDRETYEVEQKDALCAMVSIFLSRNNLTRHFWKLGHDIGFTRHRTNQSDRIYSSQRWNRFHETMLLQNQVSLLLCFPSQSILSGRYQPERLPQE